MPRKGPVSSSLSSRLCPGKRRAQKGLRSSIPTPALAGTSSSGGWWSILGIFNPELLTERYGPEVGKIWAKSRLRDRIDAVIAHEVAESIIGTHEGAEALAAETELPVSDGARPILRAMAGRGR
jgi:hypothetical protein